MKPGIALVPLILLVGFLSVAPSFAVAGDLPEENVKLSEIPLLRTPAKSSRLAQLAVELRWSHSLEKPDGLHFIMDINSKTAEPVTLWSPMDVLTVEFETRSGKLLKLPLVAFKGHPNAQFDDRITFCVPVEGGDAPTLDVPPNGELKSVFVFNERVKAGLQSLIEQKRPSSDRIGVRFIFSLAEAKENLPSRMFQSDWIDIQGDSAAH